MTRWKSLRNTTILFAAAALTTVGCGDDSTTTTGTTAGSTAGTTQGGTTQSNTTSGDTTAGPSGPTQTGSGGMTTSTSTGSTGTTDPGQVSATDPMSTTEDTDVNTVTTLPGICMDGEEQCKENGHEICENEDWVPAPCADDEYCDEQTETCVACACTPGEMGSCIENTNQFEQCLDDCSGYGPVDCPANTVCVGDACVNLVCAPGVASCLDDDTYQVCNDNGTDFLDPVDCQPGELCQGGTCVSKCEAAQQTKSNIGCEFWAVDMDNLPPRDTYVYAVALSNPDFDITVNIEIWDRNNNNQEQMIIQDTIAPRQAKVFYLSGQHNGVPPGYYAGQNSGIQGNGIALGRAFRIATDLPVLATQFNPVGGALGYTTDASLLLPTHTLGSDYYHMAWTQGHGNGTALNVVATEDNTTVTITPTVNTQGGINGLPAMTAGVPTNVVINKYDFIQVMAGLNGPDLTGSKIEATAPVAVFGGHSCADIPTTATSACDHIEEQIFPLETWGKDYIAVRNPPRTSNQNNPDPMVWRILAAEDNTTVTFDPPVSIGAMVNLDAGQYVQFQDTQNFHVTADDPILVMGYLIGCTGTPLWPQTCDGDPYMVQMVATEQYLNDYVFLVDSSYERDFAQLIRPTGAQVDVGCLGIVPENRWTAIGGSGFDTATIDMNPGEANCAPGTNEISSNQGVGVIVSGRAWAASYAYPGGLALQVINPQ